MSGWSLALTAYKTRPAASQEAIYDYNNNVSFNTFKRPEKSVYPLNQPVIVDGGDVKSAN